MNLYLEKYNFIHVAPNLTFEVETFSSFSENMLSQYFLGSFGFNHYTLMISIDCTIIYGSYSLVNYIRYYYINLMIYKFLDFIYLLCISCTEFHNFTRQ